MIKLLKNEVGLNKTTFLNLLSTIILQGIAFLTIPIFTRVLGSEQYGLYAIFNSWVSILSIIISLSLANSIASGKYYFKDEYYNFRNNIIVFNTAICTIVSLILVVFYKSINAFLSYSFIIYLVLILTAFSSNTINIITIVLIYEKKALMNFVLSVFLSAVNVLLSLYFIYNVKFTNLYEGRVYGHFIPYFIASLFLITYVILTKPFKIDFRFLKYGLAVGTPIMFHQLAHYVLGQSDRVMMQKIGVNTSDIGIYSLFYSFCGVLSIILGALNTSYTPFNFEYIDRDDKESIIEKSNRLLELFTVLSVGFLLLSREVSYIMANSEYYSGINLIPILVGSVYFNFMYLFPVNYEFFYRRTKTIACGTILAAILNIVLNLYFINKYGMYGAAYATVISYGALFVFHYIIASLMKENRFYFSIKYYVLPVIIMIITIIAFYHFAKMIYLRWILAIIIGIIEFYRIYSRRAIF